MGFRNSRALPRQLRQSNDRPSPPCLTATMLSERPHSEPVDLLLRAYSVEMAIGLAPTEVQERLARFGPNLIEAGDAVSPFAIFRHQLASPVVYLLTAAAFLAFLFGQHVEAMAVVAVLLINTAIGYWAEYKATRSMEALRTLGHRSVRVLRDGHQRMVPAEQLVPGDVVVIEAGDVVSADLRILEGSGLAANESTLTGESAPVDKSALPVPPETRLAERSSMFFRGTAVTSGSGTGLVVGTGRRTAIGDITQLVKQARPARSPLEKRLSKVAAQLVWLTMLLALGVTVAGIARDADPFLMVTTGIALAVAAIPEGLPIVATLALAQGMWRMARQNALLRQLSAVETFGSVSVILTDKTGTLTENRMVLESVCLPAMDLAPKNFTTESLAGEEAGLLRDLLTVAVLCNCSELDPGNGEGGVGDPLEIALLEAAASAGLSREQLVDEQPQVRLSAFSAETRMMATVHRHGETFNYAVKGGPEAVLAHCTAVRFHHGDQPLDDTMWGEWHELVEELGSEGMRVLAIAQKLAPSADEEPYTNLTLLGLVGLRDPARGDVADAIAACHSAGIDVAIVTGDHAVTAVSIGRQVGLPVDESEPVEGRNLARLDFDRDRLRATKVFARVDPSEKLALVKAFQDSGDVVAMTGDGVNDAPALRQADIGVAMGKRGTDVAREAADMVLLDDAFTSIVAAIREGRIIFENIRRFATYLLACNLSEVLVVGLAVLIALPLPILPLQILFLNLVTDVLPAFALATARGDASIMTRAPRPSSEPLLGLAQWRRIALHGLVLTGAVFGAMGIASNAMGLDGAPLVTVTFLTLALSQLWHVFNLSSPRSGIFRNEVTRSPWIWAALAVCGVLLCLAVYVPPLRLVLGLARPDGQMWSVAIAASLAPLLVIQLPRLLAAITGREQA